MKQEGRLWQSMKVKMWQPGDRLDRIENSLGSGAPDVNGCLSGEDFWCELKAPSEPKRSSTVLMRSNNNHGLLQTQINWFARQRQAGGIAFILVRTDKRMMLVDGTLHADDFNTWTADAMMCNAILTCEVPTPAEEWRLLRNVIFTSTRHRRLHHHARAQQLLDDLEREKVAGDSGRRGRRPVG